MGLGLSTLQSGLSGLEILCHCSWQISTSTLGTHCRANGYSNIDLWLQLLKQRLLDLGQNAWPHGTMTRHGRTRVNIDLSSRDIHFSDELQLRI